jgi:putative ABC transport system substrate-binding protein
MNNRRKLLIALSASALAAPLGSFAQQQGKVWRIGFLTGRKGRPDPTFDSVLQGLRELGYVEGKNILMEYRAVGEMPERTASLVAELVQLDVDVIVSPTFALILAARQATKTIPIVGVITNDPVAGGLADSLARPGGNFTGIARLTKELSGKRLELLKEINPGIARVGILWHANEATPQSTKEYGAAARALKLQFYVLEVRGPSPDLEGAFQSAATESVRGLIVPRHPILLGYAKQIADLAIKHRLPSICEGREFTDAGGLISYSTNDTESFKRAAYYVDKILKGAKPGDLPIEQPTRFDLIINMKTANALGIKIPDSILVRPDKVIE